MQLPESAPAMPHFKEMEPIELWSATIDLDVPYDIFAAIVKHNAIVTGTSFAGFITRNEDGTIQSFTRTRYPRKKYGINPVEQYEPSTLLITRELGGKYKLSDQQLGFRVVLGLLEGYDPLSPQHSVDEVTYKLPWADVQPAEVFSVRPDGGDASIYTEPVAIVTGDIRYVKDVYMLADTFKQERFTVEDFDQHIAYVVETRHCKQPD